jgi:hypothetical protein
MNLYSSPLLEIQGDAIYLIYDGTERDKAIMEQLLSHLERRTRKELKLLSARDLEGQRIIQHYHLHGTRFVIIIRSNLELHHVWADGDHFDATHIAYLAEQAR